MTTFASRLAAGFRRALCWEGARAAAASSPRRRGARTFPFALLVLVFACASSADFRPYRACHETPGSQLHDPGEVEGELLGDDGLRHYTFLSDRWRLVDRRNTIDVTRVNRACPLVTGMREGQPVGQLWDTSEGIQPRENP